VEIAGIGAGPFTGMMLADAGADVIRVDWPDGAPMGSGPTDVFGRGRRSISVDLKRPAGVEVVLRLAERAEVLFEGFRPGVAERLGIGPEPCLARNPALVYGRMTGWGQEGPLATTSPTLGLRLALASTSSVRWRMHSLSVARVAGRLAPYSRHATRPLAGAAGSREVDREGPD
jgi:hypothetical protein